MVDCSDVTSSLWTLKAETIPSWSPVQVSSFIIFIWHVHRSTVARFVLPKSWGSFPTCMVSPSPEPPATSSFTSNSSSAFLPDGGASSLLPSHHYLFLLTESSELRLRFEKNVNKLPVPESPGSKLIFEINFLQTVIVFKLFINLDTWQGFTVGCFRQLIAASCHRHLAAAVTDTWLAGCSCHRQQLAGCLSPDKPLRFKAVFEVTAAAHLSAAHAVRMCATLNHSAYGWLQLSQTAAS